MRYLKYPVCCLIVLTLTLSAPPTAVASILPLDGNPDALVSGTEIFSSGILNADIEYAVFGPGVFTSGAVGGMFGNPQLGGFDPSQTTMSMPTTSATAARRPYPHCRFHSARAVFSPTWEKMRPPIRPAFPHR